MKIQAYKVDEFIKTIDREHSINGALLYGPDNGLVALNYKEIAQKIVPDLKDPFNVVHLSDDKLKDNPTIIFDEFLAMSMMGGRRLITIRDAGNLISSSLKEIFKTEPNSDNFILITAGNLDAKSSLRKFAETSKNFVAIPCYQDDKNKIAQIVNQKLRGFGFKYSDDVVKELVNNFGGNRLIILNEIEKLALYKGDDKNLTISDLNDCIKDVSEIDISELINEFANLNKDRTYILLQKLFTENVNFIVVIRSLVNYFLKLQLIKFQIANGANFTDITKKQRIFWKQIPVLQKHLGIWSLSKINHFLKKLIEVEVKCKSTGSNPEMVLERFLTVACGVYGGR